MGDGYPGYNMLVSEKLAGIGEVLNHNGYNTAWFGKNQSIPDWQNSQVGPYDLWASGLGFEYFYGFIGARFPCGIRHTLITDHSNGMGVINDFHGLEMVRKWRGETRFSICHPWMVEFVFGLMHGIGFASGPSLTGVPRGEIPSAQLFFNHRGGRPGLVLMRPKFST